MKPASALLSAHVRSLWPRWPLLPTAPFWLLSAFWAVQGKLRWDHLALAVFATVLAYGSAWSKRLYLGILPIGLVGVLYDSMRAVKNVGLTPDNVHVCDLRAIDQRLFGLELNGVRTTLHDYLQLHATPFWDFYFAIPYATFLWVMVAYAVYLFRRDYPALQRFTWSFLVMNVAGFITYHLYPAAPPWYYHQHGCLVDLATHASEGPNLARVDAWLGISFFSGMYGRSSDVFGAVPSLHVAYPLLLLIDGFRRHRWLGRSLLIWFYLSMCCAAVYLDHHWVFDIVVGSLYAVVVSSLIRRVFNARLALFDQFFSRSRSHPFGCHEACRSARAETSQRESRRNRAPAASTIGGDARRLGSLQGQNSAAAATARSRNESDQLALGDALPNLPAHGATK